MSTVTSSKMAEKFRKLAVPLTLQIINLRRQMTANATSKRMREYYSRLVDGDQLESLQNGLRALADAHERGDVPEILLGVKAIKGNVAELMHLKIDRDSRDMDRVFTTGAYTNTTPIGKALQELVARGIRPEDDAEKADRARQREIESKVNALRFAKIDGFFPTPRPVVEIMLEYAAIEPAHRVLEPSAGIGSIADVIREKHPHCNLRCVEVRLSLADILRMKGHAVMQGDFLQGMWRTMDNFTGEFDRIAMNPPFENGQDVEHVIRAYGCLRDGGRLVAIMSPAFRQNQARKFAEFREWIGNLSTTLVELPPGSFEGGDAFRSTSVNTVMLVIYK